jgi:hypothetical protein
VGVAHLAFDLRLGDQGGDRVDDDQVDGAGGHQLVGDLQRLLAVVGLRDQQLFDAHAQLARITDVERVLGVDEGTDTAGALRLGNRLQRQRRLSRRLGAVDLNDPAARQAADPERDVEADRAGRDDVDLGDLAAVERHDRSLAELLFDGGDRAGHCLHLLLDAGHGLSPWSGHECGLVG